MGTETDERDLTIHGNSPRQIGSAGPSRAVMQGGTFRSRDVTTTQISIRVTRRHTPVTHQPSHPPPHLKQHDGGHRFIDIYYQDFVKDGVGEIMRLYEVLGLPFEEVFAEAIRAKLAADAERRRSGKRSGHRRRTCP